MQTRPRYPYTLGAAVLWMVLVLLVYYWIHKPLPVGDFLGETEFGLPTAAIFTNLGGALLDTLVVMVMVAVSGGLGRRVMALIVGRESELAQRGRFAMEALLGLGILGNLILVVGLVWLHAVSVGLLLAGLAIVTRQAIRNWLADLRAVLRDVQTIKNRWNRWLMIFIVFNLMLAFIMALAPPTQFDSLTYHLVGPQHWLREGRFVSLQGSHFFGFPQLINTLFAGHVALTFGRLTGAALLHWAIGVLTLIAVGSYGMRRFSARVGLLAVTILLTATSIWLQFTWPYVDLAAMGFGFAAYVALENWRMQQHSQRWLILGAVFVGLAMSVKYPLVVLGIAAGVYILVFSQRKQIIRNGLILVGVATIILVPWLLRNLVFYDNPVYPYGPATAEWDELMREWYTSSEGALLKQLPALWITMPVSSTFVGIDGAGGFAATIGPLFLLLIPMLLITWRWLDEAWRHHLKGMLPFIGVFAAVWMVASALTIYGAQTRLWYAMFPLLALWAAVGFDSLRLLPKKPLDFSFVLSAMVGMVLAFTAFDHVRGTRPESGTLEGTTLVSHFLESGAHNYLLGAWDEDDYLDMWLGWYIVTMRQINELPEDSRVLFLWETRSLYCNEADVTCLEDWVLLRWWHARRTIGDGSAEAIIDHWRQQGVTHVLVREEGRDFEFENNDFLTDEDKAEWSRVPDLLAELWRGSDSYTLYTVPERN